VEHGVSGLLFSNGDEEELAGRLAAVACGAAFPAHALSDAVVRRATERHDPAVHIECLRGIFTSLVTHSDATPAAPPKARAPLHQTWLGT
jgi:hypothetical protein